MQSAELKQLHDDLKVNFQSDLKAIAVRSQSDCKQISKRLQRDLKAIEERSKKGYAKKKREEI
jgi:hypothetical protein